MDEVKVFKVLGKIRKPNFQTKFHKEIRALKPEDAVEEVYKILGSKHKVRRFHIVIESVEEVAAERTQVTGIQNETIKER